MFLTPSTNGEDGLEHAIELSHNPRDQLDGSLKIGEQILVFKYNGKFHAIDNVRAEV